MYMYMYMSIYICIDICIHMEIYIYVHTHTFPDIIVTICYDDCDVQCTNGGFIIQLVWIMFHHVPMKYSLPQIEVAGLQDTPLIPVVCDTYETRPGLLST